MICLLWVFVFNCQCVFFRALLRRGFNYCFFGVALCLRFGFHFLFLFVDDVAFVFLLFSRVVLVVDFFCLCVRS